MHVVLNVAVYILTTRLLEGSVKLLKLSHTATNAEGGSGGMAPVSLKFAARWQ